jgi:hypothetical protein
MQVLRSALTRPFAHTVTRNPSPSRTHTQTHSVSVVKQCTSGLSSNLCANQDKRSSFVDACLCPVVIFDAFGCVVGTGNVTVRPVLDQARLDQRANRFASTLRHMEAPAPVQATPEPQAGEPQQAMDRDVAFGDDAGDGMPLCSTVQHLAYRLRAWTMCFVILSAHEGLNGNKAQVNLANDFLALDVIQALCSDALTDCLRGSTQHI